MQKSPAPSYADLVAENQRLSRLIETTGTTANPPPPDIGGDRWAAHGAAQPDFAELVLDSISEGFFVIDRAGLATACNKAMRRLLGFEAPEDVIGIDLHALIHHTRTDGSTYLAEDCPIYRAAREGTSMVVADERFFRRDGTSFPVEYRTEPLMREGRLVGAICTFVDISARVDGEDRLKESQERLALAVEAGGVGIWDFDLITNQLQWDARVRALFGLHSEAAITIKANLAAIHPDDRRRVDAALAAAFAPEGSGAYEVIFRAIGIEDGTLRWLQAQGQAAFRDGQAVRLLGVLRDISKEREAERHLRLMVNELNHRVKNSLAMVQGVAAQTFRSSTDIEAARIAFSERIVALAHAHDVLTEFNWEGADLRHVVEQATLAHAGTEGGRFDTAGPAVALSPKAVLAFSLALHELATNAVKYGALSRGGGVVTIRWGLTNGGAARRLLLTWRESGGPVVFQPQRRGFGTKLIERGLATELQGAVGIEFLTDGIVCAIDAPMPDGASGPAM